MRVLLGLATLAVATLAACTTWSSAATTPSIGTEPADGASSASAEGSRPLLFALEGGFLTPLRNGGRVAIANGQIHIRTSPMERRPFRHTTSPERSDQLIDDRRIN